MAMAVGIFRRSLEQLPTPLGSAVDEISRFERNCCHCLINSNYLTVGKYKVEALLMYATIEYTKRGNSAMSVSVILGITIKLAMRMGYHRDAKHYSNISALEGEMRRRTWTIICQLDTLTAFQAGIPKQSQSWQSDTELPRNILDEDFDENSIELPPSKPDSVKTQTTYLISKARVMTVFGQIADLAYSRHPISYEKVLELDRKLEEAHELIASPLRMRPLNQSVTDNAGLIMKRYTLDVLYQKARIVLHRKYLVEARYNPILSYSRSVCVNAAKDTLRQQYDLYHESQKGGRLDKDNWFFRSLQNHDFVLAAMVICLELFKYPETVSPTDAGQQQRQPQSQQESSTPTEERAKLIYTLRKSQEIWQANLEHSMEARKAFSALTIMLKKADMDDEARKRSSQSPVQPSGQSSLLQGTNSTRNISPDMLRTAASPSGDIAIGESASSRGLGGINGQGMFIISVSIVREDPSNIFPSTAYFDNFLSPSSIPTPPKSNSSNNLETPSTSTINSSIQQQQQQQPRHASIPGLDVFQQQYPGLQSSLPELDMIQNMLDTPQNLDWVCPSPSFFIRLYILTLQIATLGRPNARQRPGIYERILESSWHNSVCKRDARG
jgi:Fungal specific transcription factor domain